MQEQETKIKKKITNQPENTHEGVDYGEPEDYAENADANVNGEIPEDYARVIDQLRKYPSLVRKILTFQHQCSLLEDWARVNDDIGKNAPLIQALLEHDIFRELKSVINQQVPDNKKSTPPGAAQLIAKHMSLGGVITSQSDLQRTQGASKDSKNPVPNVKSEDTGIDYGEPGDYAEKDACIIL